MTLQFPTCKPSQRYIYQTAFVLCIVLTTTNQHQEKETKTKRKLVQKSFNSIQ